MSVATDPHAPNAETPMIVSHSGGRSLSAFFMSSTLLAVVVLLIVLELPTCRPVPSATSRLNIPHDADLEGTTAIRSFVHSAFLLVRASSELENRF